MRQPRRPRNEISNSESLEEETNLIVNDRGETVYAPDSKRQVRLNELLLEFLIDIRRSVDLVENRYFIRFIKGMDPKYNVCRFRIEQF